MKVSPSNDFVFCRKCFNDDLRDEEGNVLIYRTEAGKDTTNYAEVLAVGPKCRCLTKDDVGKFVLLPEYISGMYRLGSISESEDFAVREKVILMHMPAVFDETEN